MATEHNIDEYEPQAAPRKLTKAQKEFFGTFAANAVENILGPVLEFKGVEITAEQVSAVVKTLDLSQLTNAIGSAFIDRVDFKTILKVDKFMKSVEFASVVAASTEVNGLVQSELVQIIAPLIPHDEPEAVEPSAEQLADIAA
jgi:hypothetical protein